MYTHTTHLHTSEEIYICIYSLSRLRDPFEMGTDRLSLISIVLSELPAF